MEKLYTREEILKLIEKFTEEKSLPRIITVIINDIATCIRYELDTGTYLWHDVAKNEDFDYEELEEKGVRFISERDICVLYYIFEDSAGEFYPNIPEFRELINSIDSCVQGEVGGYDFWGADEDHDVLWGYILLGTYGEPVDGTIDEFKKAYTRYAINPLPIEKVLENLQNPVEKVLENRQKTKVF